MNKNQMQGKWKQLKGKARRAWAGLSGDDVGRMDATGEQLAGAIQEKAGDVKASIKKSA